MSIINKISLQGQEYEFSAEASNIKIDDNTTLDKKIDEIDTKLLEILNKVYPIGSIYMSINKTNPSDLFGGTWVAWGSGQVPVGVNEQDEDFATSDKTGGVKTIDLIHSHNVNNHTHTINNHIHTINNHTHTINGHTHQYTDTKMTSHTHTINGHHHLGTLGFDSQGYYTSNNFGSDTIRPSSSTEGWLLSGGTSTKTGNVRLSYTSTTNLATNGTNASSENRNTTSTGLTTNATGLTTNATGLTTNGTTTTTDSQLNANTKILQPYITCYMWKRIA